jgi:AraC family transcriptional regulator
VVWNKQIALGKDGSPILLDDLELQEEVLHLKTTAIIAHVGRYRTAINTAIDDTANFAYEVNHQKPDHNFIELNFFYVKTNANEKRILNLYLKLNQNYMQQLPKNLGNSFLNNLLQFKHPLSIQENILFNNKIKLIIEQLCLPIEDSHANIWQMAQIHLVIFYALENLKQNNSNTFTCKFLVNQDGKQKVIRAKELLLQNLDQQLTIKELAKLTGLNECYLKKGFKEMFGCTIYELYQQHRMEFAKTLLYQEHKTVKEVAYTLGYSNISHFSTAFKKHTGIKPCTLLALQ